MSKYFLGKLLSRVLPKQKTTGTEVISSVNIGKNLTKKKTIKDDLIKSRDKHLAGVRDEAKVEIKSKNPLSKFTKKIEKIVDKKATGGRVGLKRGTSLMQKKSNVQKIKETFSPKKSAAKKSKKSTKFGMLSVKAGIDKNPNPTQADRIAGAKMKNKKRFV
jgi:hypothetical protein